MATEKGQQTADDINGSQFISLLFLKWTPSTKNVHPPIIQKISTICIANSRAWLNRSIAKRDEYGGLQIESTHPSWIFPGAILDRQWDGNGRDGIIHCWDKFPLLLFHIWNSRPYILSTLREPERNRKRERERERKVRLTPRIFLLLFFEFIYILLSNPYSPTEANSFCVKWSIIDVVSYQSQVSNRIDAQISGEWKFADIRPEEKFKIIYCQFFFLNIFQCPIYFCL